jgi:hypothetical protein
MEAAGALAITTTLTGVLYLVKISLVNFKKYQFLTLKKLN